MCVAHGTHKIPVLGPLITMAHFIVEYSANIKDELDVPALLARITKTAAETGVFPLGGIRTRAIRHEEYHVADGAEENAFVYVTAKVGRGREPDVLNKACAQIFETVTESLTSSLRHPSPQHWLRRDGSSTPCTAGRRTTSTRS